MEVIRGESFYDWCQRTGNQSFLLRWDYEKNEEDPKSISKSKCSNYYFKCENGLHESEKRNLNHIFKTKRIPSCSICSSFGVWCESNSRKDILKRWDYEQNGCSPYEVLKNSHKEFYFKCSKNIHDSELKKIDSIVREPVMARCIQCDSIGQWGIDTFGDDFIDKYWSSKNTSDPMKISKRSNKPIMIKCQKTNYHNDYQTTCDQLFRGRGCPYCAGKLVDVNDSLGALYPESIKQWVQKDLTPFDYLPNSNKSVYWYCKIHGKYKRKIQQHVCGDLICPKCLRESKESRLQKKVRKYLESKQLTINHEFNCNIIATNKETNRPLPYDNEVVDYNLIIEVHGMQHYKPCEWFDHNRNNMSSEEYLEHRKYLDRLKKRYAISQGYEFLAIPYWTDDKKETWKTLIDRKIKSICCSIQTNNANSQA